MPKGVHVTREVTEDKVNDVVNGYKAQKPLKVEKKKNPNGTFDVIATFPE